MINKLINWLHKFKEQTINAAAIFFTFTIAAILTGLVATFINSGLVSLVVFIGSFFALRWTLNKYIIIPALDLKKKEEEAKVVKAKNLEEEKAITVIPETYDTTKKSSYNRAVERAKPLVEVVETSGAADVPKPLHKMSEQQRKIIANRNIRKRRNTNK